MDENGGSLPSVGRIIVAENDNEIKGFVVVQLVMHVEPLWIGDPRVSLKRMIGEVKNIVEDSDFYTFTSNDKAERIASLFGLVEKNWKVFSRR